MTEPEQPQVTDVPEPDQEPHEPFPDTADDDEGEAQSTDEDQTDADQPPETEGDDDEVAPGTAAHAQVERDQQKAIEKMFDAFEREDARHVKRVGEIAGDSATELIVCPLCAPDEGQPTIRGFLLPVEPSAEKTSNVRAMIGLPAKIDYREDPHSKVCDTCGGLRQVKPTGLEYGDTLLPCADCGSNGWVPTDEKRGGNVAAPTNGITVSAGTPKLATAEPDSPEVESLRQQGYTVIAPYVPAN